MQHEEWTYIFLTAGRKNWHHDLPGDWEEVAFERFDYIECGVFRKKTADIVSDVDLQFVEYNGEPRGEWISPSGWLSHPANSGMLAPTLFKAEAPIISDGGAEPAIDIAAQYSKALLKSEREAIARMLWAKARELDKRAEDALVGYAKMELDERAIADARSRNWWGGSQHLESMAWIILGRSGEPIRADFFEPTEE